MNSETLAIAQKLVDAVEARDPYSKGHSQVVARAAVTLAEELGYAEDHVAAVERAALLHDIGNLEVDSRILTKPGPLTAQEFGQVQQHPIVGSDILASIPSLREVAPVVASHHERFDGRGYPEQRARQDIPEESRLLAVAETFGALVSPRAHRRAYAPSKALIALRTGAQAQLDPEMVEAFSSGLLRLVPENRFDLETAFSLEEVVAQEKERLRYAFITLSRSYLGLYDRLVGHYGAAALEEELNQLLKRHGLTVTFRRGTAQDHTPGRVSPEKLAEIYRVTLAREVAGVERLLGREMSRRLMETAYRGLSPHSRRLCHEYRLCHSLLQAKGGRPSQARS